MELTRFSREGVNDLRPAVRLNVEEAKDREEFGLTVEGPSLVDHDAAQDVSNITPEALLDTAAKFLRPFGVEIDPESTVALKGRLKAVDSHDVSQAARRTVQAADRG